MVKLDYVANVNSWFFHARQKHVTCQSTFYKIVFQKKKHFEFTILKNYSFVLACYIIV